MKTTILLLSLFMMMQASCNREEDPYNPTLPEATKIGANTFGCKINGQIMVPKDSRVSSQPGGAPTGVTYARNRTLNKHYDWIEAIDRVENRGGIAFKLPNIDSLGVGEYIIKHVEGAFSRANPNIVYMGAISVNGFYSSIEATGKIIITRYDDEVISGTFYCTLKNDYDPPNDIIEVTEGRFDFNKSTINTTKFR
ncbi:MAG: hypothetical protein L3J09_06430 [Flavobacteriaceae bacterium]|nr:hypothetical protein [Flavobacteriaceae bacterium]